MALFKDTGGTLRLHYFEKMVEAETLWEAAVKQGRPVNAEKYRVEAATYAALLTAVSTTLLTK